MKKNGFTLVELLGVIIIISILSLLVVPKITERFNQKQIEASEMAKEILYSATREYITTNQYLFNTEESYYCITINDLIEDGKLVDPVIDSTTGSTISNNIAIEVSKQNNQYHFAYDTDNCSGSLELIPSIDKSTLTIRVNSSISEENLPPEPYSFDNGLTWQRSNDYTINSYYSNIVKVRTKNGDIRELPLSIGKLTINANGGIYNSLSENTIYWLKMNETITLNGATKLGFRQIGWSGLNGTGSTISNNVFKMGNSATTLIANWEQSLFTLTVNTADGTMSETPPANVISGKTATINNPTRINYVFNGWIVSGTGSSMTGTTFKMGTENTSLTAKWRVINASDYTYSGSSTYIYDGDDNWRIKFLTSGTLIPSINLIVDSFTVGGGGGGSCGGGGGGYTNTTLGVVLEAGRSYSIVVGAGGTAGSKDYGLSGDGGVTYAFGIYTLGGTGGGTSAWGARGGGRGGSGGGGEAGAGGSDGSNGVSVNSSYPAGGGQATTTREFGLSTGTLYSGGGGGGCWGSGGEGGGGTGARPNGVSGEDNTGGGGGGTCDDGTSGAGGSGIVVIRNSLTKVTETLAILNKYTYTGSCVVFSDGDEKWRIKFLTNGVFNPSISANIKIFLVGGGGGGACGGGGGGFTKTYTEIPMVAGTSYPITIGAGGSPGKKGAVNGTAGGATSGFGKTANGGGAGGTVSGARAGGAGGSGGGSGGSAGGTNGGNGGAWSSDYPAGKGQGTTTREFGLSTGTLYAGGGGGECWTTGGSGGGGNGSRQTGFSGLINTGGGGGGTCDDNNEYYGGYGGSGIAVIGN